jgi:hypothetical protein
VWDYDVVSDNAAALQSYLHTMSDIYVMSGASYSWQDFPGGMIKAFTMTYNPCSPMLSVPTKLLAMNSAWNSCQMGISAFYDPPYILTTAGSLSLITADPTARSQSGPTILSTLHPGPTPAPELATKTPLPELNSLTVEGPEFVNPPVPTAGGYLIGSQTLSAGGPAVTMAGTVFSLLADGSNIDIGNTKTEALGSFLAAQNGDVGYIFGTQTLSAGGSAITVDQTMLSLMAGGSSLVVGSQTEGASDLLGASVTNTSGGMASAHSMTTRGSSQKTPSSSSSKTSTSAADAIRQGGGCWSRTLGLVMGLWIIGVGLL